MGLGERGVKGEREGSGGQGASHGDTAVRRVGLCGRVVQAALVGGLGGDSWSEEWFKLRVETLDGL